MFNFLVALLMLTTSSLVAMDGPLMAEEEVALEQALSEMTEEEREKALLYLQLDWKKDGTYKFSDSNSTLSLPFGYRLLIGDEANKSLSLRGEPEEEFLEAIVYCDFSDDMIMFERSEKGYVTLEDWEEIKPKELLESIIKNTEKSNKTRFHNGVEEIHVLGWVKEPTLDKMTNTVYWAIEAQSDGDFFINSVALKLGRESYETINWICSKDSYMSSAEHLDEMLRAHSFDPGFRYEDHTTDDKIAKLGIAALVTASVGGKIIKAGGFLFFLKKIFGFVLAGLAAIFYKVKSFFGTKNK